MRKKSGRKLRLFVRPRGLLVLLNLPLILSAALLITAAQSAATARGICWKAPEISFAPPDSVSQTTARFPQPLVTEN